MEVQASEKECSREVGSDNYVALGALPWSRLVHTLSLCPAVTVICAAPGVDGAWWRAQVVASYEETNEVEIRYVDYGGYKRVKVDVLRQIR